MTFNPSKMRLAIVAAVVATAGLAGTAHAASSSDRGLGAEGSQMRENLETLLKGANGKAVLDGKLAAAGYAVTAINDFEKDHVEYEVVKGQHTFEVKFDLDDETGKVEDIDVAPNLWRAKSTELAMRGQAFELTRSAAHSDRKFEPAWRNDKTMLEKTLGAGMTGGQLRSALTGLGYTVTAVNDIEKDYVEYEVVKGHNTYEIQVDMDGKTGKSTKVDVTANIWKADSTEKALNRAG